uniref:Left end of bacteriophage phi-29 coding for 15 potential proteins Among these are the terminal protein and the proteins encoded by the genes 1, 2 (sus), 3, and (probably) 4 n=1 Tax=Salasvirus phi29 TaxID=10756 RepID=Q38506_9CAUD|nr:unnamed protein product [Bacillus phage phi29]
MGRRNGKNDAERNHKDNRQRCQNGDGGRRGSGRATTI